MFKMIIVILSGALFGAGLAASDMNNPERVQSFLDLFGQWDPTLMFVMGGALLVALPAIQWTLRTKDKPLFGKRFYLPLSSAIDHNLIVGAVLFGMGWALVGYCPGPAIASLSYGYIEAVLFITAMMLGAKAHQWQTRKA